MTKIVQSASDAVKAIEALGRELPNSAELASRLGQAHAFYVINEQDDQPGFGFSKFVGYKGLTADSYLAHYKDLTGINTEHALAEWFDEVGYGSPLYKALHRKLSAWMEPYGKRPRQGASQKLRLMVLKPEYRDTGTPRHDDRAIVDLLIAVAGRLPPHQRRELRASL